MLQNDHFSYSSICYTDVGQHIICNFKRVIDEFTDCLNAKFNSINNLPGEPISYKNIYKCIKTILYLYF